jgi:hypothetical protein
METSRLRSPNRSTHQLRGNHPVILVGDYPVDSCYLGHPSAKKNLKLVILSEREQMRARVEGSMYFAKVSSRLEDVGKTVKEQTQHAASLP